MKKGTKHSESSKRKMRQSQSERRKVGRPSSTQPWSLDERPFAEGFNRPGFVDRLRRRFVK